jgi:hypothetical protein
MLFYALCFYNDYHKINGMQPGSNKVNEPNSNPVDKKVDPIDGLRILARIIARIHYQGYGNEYHAHDGKDLRLNNDSHNDYTMDGTSISSSE